MSARQRARLSQNAAIEASNSTKESDSEEEVVNTARKPAFVFSASNSDNDSDEEDDKKEESPEDDFINEHDNFDELGVTPDDAVVSKSRERNSNFSKKKKEATLKSVGAEKEGDPDGMSFEELSKLICNSEMTLMASPLLQKEKDTSTDPTKMLAGLLKVDIKGLDIDSIMKRRFGGMAVNDLPVAAQAGGGGVQQRRFAAAVASAEKTRARMAKLSNKVTQYYVLYAFVLYCTVLYCTVMCCIVMCCVVLYCIDRIG